MQMTKDSILTFIQKLNALHYNVSFCEDFEGMVRLELRHGFEPKHYEHWHLGYPDANPAYLQEKILEKLTEIYNEKNLQSI